MASYEDDTLAAEYVLRLLSDREHRATEERLAVDGGFRALVAHWSENMAALADGVEPVAAPRRLRARVAAIADEPAKSAAGAASRRSKRGFLSGGLGLVFGALTAVLIITLVLPPVTPDQEGPVYTASLSGQETDLLISARFDPQDNVLALDRQAGAARPGRALQLWLIADGNPPISLGVLAEAPTARIPVPEDLSDRVRGGILAISDEPMGGSPTGLPTGEVLAAGEVTEI